MNNIEIPEDNSLAFIDKIGTTVDGKYIYRFDFTQAPDIVWGDSWNVVPCSIIPNLSPDPQTLSYMGYVETDMNFNLAKNNSCFSMQDCIDGIIALCFTNPRDDKELILNFGESVSPVVSKLNKLNLQIINVKKINQEQEDKIIDATINALGSDDNGTPFDKLND